MASLNDVIDPLCVLAQHALSDPYGLGMMWTRAVAKGNVYHCPNERTNISGSDQIVVGKNMRGHVNRSFVVDLGKGKLTATNSVVAGNFVAVRTHGITRVIGKNPRVSRISGVTHVIKKDVRVRNLLRNTLQTRPSKQCKRKRNAK